MSTVEEKFEALEKKSNSKYDTLIVGKIRKWWDLKTPKEQKEFVIDVANFCIGVGLIAGTAAITYKATKRYYDNKELEDACFVKSGITFNVDSEADQADVIIVRGNPTTGEVRPYYRLNGSVSTFNETAKAFTDAASYIKQKTADNQYAKVIYGTTGRLEKYHKPM